MKKLANRMFGSPYFLRELRFAAKYATLLQFLLAFVFCGSARFGGPLGSLQTAEWFCEGAVVTLTVYVCFEILFFFHRKSEN